jgi:hypothetical protein
MMSGSTFDTLTPEQVEELSPEHEAILAQDDFAPEVSVYDSCSRLAAGYTNLRIRRGVVIRNGEAQAEPLDFLCDLHLKARRYLDLRGFTMWQVFSQNGASHLLPKKYQDILSAAWLNTFHTYADLFKAAARKWLAEEHEEKLIEERRAASADYHTAQAESTAMSVLEDSQLGTTERTQ